MSIHSSFAVKCSRLLQLPVQSKRPLEKKHCAIIPHILYRWRSKNADKSSSASVPDGTFKADEMEITLVPDENLKKKPDDVSNLAFGRTFTDYMFSVKWDAENGWGIPKIEPVNSFRLHPASKCLHYGVELFEGMKAYKGTDGDVRLFRPDLNITRLMRGAKRLVLPTFDPNEFIECIKRLVKLEQDWVPDVKSSSLYIRPVYIGTEAALGVSVANAARLYVLCCPVGPFFPTGFKPISLYADPKYSRSWIGGCGDIKLGGNYGPTIYVQKAAEKKGCQQVLWLHGKDQEITEVGIMNIFLVIKNDKGERELVTPPLNGLILPGVTRQSILELCRDWKELQIVERSVTISEIKELLDQKRLREMFGSGTACVVCPVSSIFYEGSKYDIPTAKQDNPVHARIMKALSAIHYGKVEHPWAVKVND